MKHLFYTPFLIMISFLKFNQKKATLIIILLAIFTVTFSQTDATKKYHLKLSGGQVSFGTGDFQGYSLGVEASKNILRKSYFGLDKLLFGGELIFENGVKNPVIKSPTNEEFFSKSFQHISSTILWTKISYYPFKKIISGFNIQVGPSFGHTYRSTESRASRTVDASGQSSDRVSTLFFDNGFRYGYRISTGIEFNINKKYLTGFRLDFSNNNEGEINTFAGIKAGIKL